MKQLWLLLVILLSWPSAVASAPLESFDETLENIDAVMAHENTRIIDARPEVLWLDAKYLLFRSDSEKFDIALIEVGPNLTKTALTADDWLRRALVSVSASPLGTKLSGMSPKKNTLYIRSGDQVYAIDLASRTARLDPAWTQGQKLGQPQLISDQFPTTFGPLIEAASPDGASFVGVEQHNIYIRDRQGTKRMLTSDGTPKYSWLDTEESAQGMNAFWSPDGTRLAAVRLDSRDVAYESLVHWLDRAPTIHPVAYPRAGDPIHRFELAIINVADGARVPILTGPTDNHYVNLIGWTGDGNAVLYQLVDREQKSLRIYRANAQTGEAAEILSERRATYMDTAMTLAPTLVHPLRRGGFIYLSERTGWRHIYLHDDDGKLLKTLTVGNWLVEDIVRIDEVAGWVYFRASRAAPYAARLSRVRLTGGAVQELTSSNNVREVSFAPGTAHMVTIRSSPRQMPLAELSRSDGSFEATLSIGRAGPGLPTAEPFVTTSADKRFAVHGIIVRPANFDPAKRYPVVEIIYGGMQLDFLPRDAYATGWWRQGYNAIVGRILANQDVVAVYLNSPGTPNRGRAFQDATYGIWPQTVIADHAKYIRDAAATRPWMDIERTGIFGNSWGGYLAQRAMIDAPDFYKAAVSLAPPSDFIDHPTYIEPFMGLPSSNPEGYAAGSNLTRVGSIEGQVLVMPMPLDVNAGFSPGMKFLDAMITAEKNVEFFTLPDVNHRVNCCGWTRERHAYAVITRFLRNSLAKKAD